MAKPIPRPFEQARVVLGQTRTGQRSQLLRDRVLPGLLAVQLFLYFFWQVTQFDAVSGTWYQSLFHKSGPVLLPIMFVVELVLFALAAPIAWAERQVIRRHWPVVFLLIFIAGGLLTIPLAYLAHFDKVKIWKDVAFLLGYLTAPLVLLFRREIARGFLFLYLGLAFLAGIAMLAEAVHRAAMAGQTVGQFLLTTYRIFGGGGQLTELLLVFGAVAILGSYRGRLRSPLFALLVVLGVWFAARQRLDYTRLTWISLGLSLPIIIFLLLPARIRRSALLSAIGLGVVFILMTPLIGALANQTDLSSRFKPSQDVSVTFRLIESKILLQKVVHRPLTGWGPGGTISPHVASEPTRNNTSSFFDGYLGIPYKFGIPLLLVLLAAVVGTILSIWQGLKRPLARLDAAAAAGAGAFLIGVLTTTAASDILFANFSALPVGLMIGIGLRMVSQDGLALASADS